MSYSRESPGSSAATGATISKAGGPEITAEHTASHRQLPLARAAVFAPAGRRTRFLALVECPHCQCTHVHYGAEVADLLAAVRSGCGKRYRLAALRLAGTGVAG